MSDVLLSVSNSHVFYKGRDPVPAETLHKPYFWAFPPRGGDVKGLRRSILQNVEHAKAEPQGDNDHPLAGVTELGPVEQVESFWRDETREAFRVYTRHPAIGAKISDHVFDKFDAYTAEHDIPYQQRLAVDLAAQGHWPFATGGVKKTLDVMVFDIETTQYGNKGVRNDQLPIDVMGYARFPFTYQAKVDLASESFDLDILDAPQDWEAPEIVQVTAVNPDEEIDLLADFCQVVRTADIISGHNVFGFDNLKIHDRIEGYLKGARKDANLSPETEKLFTETLSTWLWKDKTYQFGRPDDIAVLHPSTLDTLLAARRFYFFRDDFTLKGMAPFLGIDIPDRQYVDAHALDVRKPETLKYHLDDIREQLGLSMHFMLQALPLAFATGMTFEHLFQGMNTKMWDHIGMIRGAHRKRLIPATSRAQAICGRAQRGTGMTQPKMDDIVRYARGLRGDEREGQSGREFMRVAKYGDEMPEWVEYPNLITDVSPEATDANGYAIAGGMTLHPQDLSSHFIPWWHVVAADVGAMYPTILKALNVGADTIQLARTGETPDAWVWLKRVDAEFQDSGAYVTRPPNTDEEYADRGVMVGIKKREAPGGVNLGMSAILGMITKVKRALAAAKAPGSGADPAEIKRLQLNYASLKAARNAGTHGILVAVNVSCRQFNVLAGAHITTEGQRILHESLRDLEAKGIRVVYGDTDGIYLACGRNGANIPNVAAAYNAANLANPDDWMTTPEDAVTAVDELNERFRRELDYQDFELEPELHDAMVFVVHKNYLIFDAYDGKLHMETKGNNFKGSDKADLARMELAKIMERSMGENLVWKDEEGARKSMQNSIKRAAAEAVTNLQVSTADPKDLILVQNVRPAKAYKPNPDGTPSTFAKRSEALDALLRRAGMDPLRAARKFKFVVANRPLPGLEVAGKRRPGIKPIEFMWPKDVLEMAEFKKEGYRIDLEWYKDMLQKYIQGAFGFDDLSTVEKTSLDQWL